MTESKHVYTAVVIGTPDLALTVKGGSVTLDDTFSPHVSGTVIVSRPAPSTIAKLDPRLNARIRITAVATFPTQTQNRTFDLGLRRVDTGQTPAELNLEVSSDESLLVDWAPLADDRTPMSLASSLRGVVNYVLNKVIPGTSLQASPANDANVTPRWDTENLILNPTVRANIAHWSLSNVTANLTRSTNVGFDGVAGSARVGEIQSAAGALYAVGSSEYVAVSEGETYTWAIYAIGSTGTLGKPRIRVLDSGGNHMQWLGAGNATTALGAAYQRLVYTVRMPPGAARAMPYLEWTNAPANASVYGDGAMFCRGEFDPGYFDGQATDTSTYRYDWADAADNSISQRTLLVDAVSPDALVWRAGQYAIDFLLPLVQANGLRLVCDEARKWTLRSETYAEPGGIDMRYPVNLISADDSVSRNDETWFDAAVTVYEWTQGGLQNKAVDAFALQTPYTRSLTFLKPVAYPGPGFSAYAVRRAQGRGREVSATTVADWRAKAEMGVSIILPGVPAQLGRVSVVAFNLDTDEYTVTARTVDTPLGAIDLLTGTINSKTGTINALTT